MSKPYKGSTQRTVDNEALRYAIDHSMEGIALLDAAGLYTYMNQAHAAMYGFTPEELLEKSWHELYEPTVIETIEREYFPILLAYGRWHGELVGRKQDGAAFDVEVSLTLLSGAGGQPTGLVCTCRDISERKRIQQALKLSEERFEQAIQAADVGVFEHNHLTDALYWSPTMRQIYGVEPDRPASLHAYLAMVHADDLESVMEAVHRAHAQDGDGLYDVRHRIVRPDGIVRWVTIRSQTSFAGTGLARCPVKTVGVMVDVTEQEEAALAVGNLAALVNSSEDAIIGKDLTGVVTSWNNGAERLFGYSADEMIGQPVTRLFPLDQVDEEPAILDRLVKGETLHHYETVRIRKDGRKVDISLTVSPVRDAAGRIIGASKIARDITERKRREMFLAAERQALEWISLGTPLQNVLEQICLTVETYASPVRCSVLLTAPDGSSLILGAAPNLPDAYNQAIEGIPIGPTVGSCGSAAYYKTPVFAPDIATNPLWNKYRDLALSHGLKACWSVPLLTSAGDVLGTLALYYGQPQHPEESDRQLILQAGRLAEIAIIRSQLVMALRASTERLELANSVAKLGMYDWELGSDRVTVSAMFGPLWGLPAGTAISTTEQFLAMVHPSDRVRIGQFIEQALEEKDDGVVEYRAIWPDESVHWLRDCFQIFRGVDGQAIRVVGTVLDVTNQKIAEKVLQQDRAVLEKRVKQRTVALYEAITALRNENKMRCQLAQERATLFEQVDEGRTRLEALSHRLLTTQESERRAVARDLHDEIGQTLTALKFNLQKVACTSKPLASSTLMVESIQLVDQMMDSARDLALDLHPSVLDDLGLVPALRWYLRRQSVRTGCPIRFTAGTVITRYADDLKLTCFRIVQEAITNVARHARASQVAVRLHEGKGRLTVTVKDNGIGFSLQRATAKAKQRKSLGLVSMEERARLINGQLVITSRRGKGTVIRASFPLMDQKRPRLKHKEG